MKRARVERKLSTREDPEVKAGMRELKKAGKKGKPRKEY